MADTSRPPARIPQIRHLLGFPIALGLALGVAGCAESGGPAGKSIPPAGSTTSAPAPLVTTQDTAKFGAARARFASDFAQAKGEVSAPAAARPRTGRRGSIFRLDSAQAEGEVSAPAEAPLPGMMPGMMSGMNTSLPAFQGMGMMGRTPDAQPSLESARADRNAEAYNPIVDNAFVHADREPLSTFSIDVDTASYANVRRFLDQGMLPPPDAVRIEELVNYFPYDYPSPSGDKAFAANVEIARCPWSVGHRLVRVGLKGKTIQVDRRPAANLVFLLDVSGSMADPAKLPLLQSGLKQMVDALGENDRVAIVVYAGAEGLALPSTTCEPSHKGEILAALDRLQAGGSTNGGAGLTLAYQIAVQNFLPGCTNRVILCTDGDFNVGLTTQDALTSLIREKARSKVFLSVLGFGSGNLKDATMEQLADLGNGNYAYIDSLQEARKVLVEQMSGTLVTIAKDVKIQVEFNPAKVAAYRLIGYENRKLANQDFRDDTKDAGEIGAGHTVTALYEIVPPGAPEVAAAEAPAEPLKYGQKPADPPAFATPAAAEGTGNASDETLTVKIRFKAPEGDVSREIERGVVDPGLEYSQASPDFKFATAVASFGMLLRDSPHKGQATLPGILELAEEGRGPDANGYRAEFLNLVRQAQQIRGTTTGQP